MKGVAILVVIFFVVMFGVSVSEEIGW